MSLANSSASSQVPTNDTALNAARCAFLTSLLVFIAAMPVATLAYFQLHLIGLSVVAAALVTMLFAIAQSHLAEQYFAHLNQPFAVVLAPMFARMIVPLMFVIAVVAWNHPRVPTWSAMYIAPLYFVMLVAETWFSLRRAGLQAAAPLQSTTTTPTSAGRQS